jgi:hypothetical protein
VINGEGTGCDGDCVVKFMETYWSSGNWPGHGTEVDWARTFWDYHTNDPGAHGSWPSHAQMQRELGASGTMGQKDSYDRLRIGVAAESGCSQYERLVYYAAANGADHCDGACDNVPSCTDCDSSGCP